MHQCLFNYNMQYFAEFEKRKSVLLDLDLKHIKLIVNVSIKSPKDLGLLFNTHVVRVKPDSQLVSELQESFASSMS